MLQRRLFLILAVAVFLGLFFVPSFIGLLTDWWWFQEIGYQIVFTRELVTRVLIFLVVGGLTFGLLYLNLRIAQRGLVPNPVVLRFIQSAPRVDITRPLRRLSLPVSLTLGLLAGLAATPAWSLVLRVIHATPFGIRDPIFSRDIGFYVFTLPGISAALGFLSAITILSLLPLIPIYALRGDIVLGPRRLSIEPSAGMHIASLLAAFFVLTALRLWLVDIPGLLYSTTGPLVGASYTDLHARLPALRVSAFVAAALRHRRPGRRYPAAAAGLRVSGDRRLYGAGRRRARPRSDGRAEVRGGAHRADPGDAVSQPPHRRHPPGVGDRQRGDPGAQGRGRSHPGRHPGQRPDHRERAALGPGAAAPDLRPAPGDPHLLRLRLGGRRPLSDRRPVPPGPALAPGAQPGVAADPDLHQRAPDLHPRHGAHHEPGQPGDPRGPAGAVHQGPAAGLRPCRSSSTRPQIYYGELTNYYVFVGTRQREFDHPSGEANVYTTYEGKGGVPVGNVFRRAMLAAHFGSSKILFSGDITSESRVLYNRTITERAKKALPFLLFDADPYMVIAADGTLKWILDAYTASNGYPYAQRLRDGTNYMRNSVKLVIDAYDGSLTAYVSAPDDPLIRTWSRIFPGIFSPLDSMPADLRAHIRYPDGIYRIQTSLYTTYHMEAPEDFYHREDQWQIPTAGRERGSGAVHAAHHHAAAGGEERRVHLHGAVHAAGEGQPGGVDGGAERRRRVRQAPGLPALPAEPGVRSPADREPDQPEHRDRSAGVALGPAGLPGDPGRPAGDPDRGVAAVRPAAVSAGRRAGGFPSSSG